MIDINNYKAINLNKILFKSFMGLGIFLQAMSAYALDFTPNPSRILSDLAYLPKDNQFVSTTNYSYTRTTGDVYDYLGSLNNSFVETSNSLSQSYSYGISDELTLRITAAYGMNSTARNHSAGTSTSSVAYGLDDPVLEMTWRVFDQNEHALNWDVIVSYAPDLVQAIAASATQDGSVARGGQAATLGSALSYKTNDFTVYFYGNASYLSRRDVSDNINTITSYDPNWQYSMGLNTQTRLNEVLAINAGMTRTVYNHIYGTDETTFIAFDDTPGNIVAFNAALVYNITPNKLVTALTYNHGIYSNSDIVYATNPLLNTTTKGRSMNTVGARLQYMFD